MNLNEYLELSPAASLPFEDSGAANEEFELAVAVLETGVFTGDFPVELLTGLFGSMVPGANPAV